MFNFNIKFKINRELLAPQNAKTTNNYSKTKIKISIIIYLIYIIIIKFIIFYLFNILIIIVVVIISAIMVII